MFRLLRRLFALAFVAALAAVGWLWYFSGTPVRLPQAPYEFTVHAGQGLKAVGHQLATDGVLFEGESLWIVGRILGKGRHIQAGTYRLDQSLTPLQLIEKLERGDVVVMELLFREGTTWAQWLAAINAHPKIKHTLPGKSDAELRALFGLTDPLEGWFFPDTYRFAPNSPDVEVLKRAHGAMKKRLADVWARRDPEIPLTSPYEALTLASIVEKETALAEERPMVAAVFMNRLKRGMRLQTDPTVIYGMGEQYAGNIRKRDLTTDTPWNTYTRDGLPPTPIAMPGAGALAAAVNPGHVDYLYFVAKGDGSHAFSRSLEEHNRAVAKYQLGR